MVPTIALYASPSTVCSAPHQVNSHASYDLDINGWPNSSASASPSQKSITGGLSCLFSTPTIKSGSYSAGSEDLGFLWHDRTDELGSSYRYSSSSSSSKRDQAHQSPAYVLQGPNSSVGLGSRSPPLRFSADFNSIRSGSGVMFNSFVSHALGSCVDYNLSDMAIDDKDFNLPSSSSDELTFNMRTISWNWTYRVMLKSYFLMHSRGIWFLGMILWSRLFMKLRRPIEDI